MRRRLSLWIVRLAAHIAPARDRDRIRKEWQAELWHMDKELGTEQAVWDVAASRAMSLTVDNSYRYKDSSTNHRISGVELSTTQGYHETTYKGLIVLS